MSHPTVLLAVDDALIRWALEKELSACGVEVRRVRAIDARTPGSWAGHGLIFLDLALTGANCLARIDSIHDASPETRVVVLGCDVDPAVKRTAFDRGAWQVVEKPFDLREVVGLVRSVFGSHSRRRSHRRYLCRLPLRVFPLAPESGSPVRLDTLSCDTVDVGPGGMRLQTGYRLRVGQRLRASVLHRSDPCAAHVPPDGLAEVVWMDTAGSGFVGGLRWVAGATPDRTS